MSSKINKTRAIYLLLALAVGFRTLVVPGLTPVVDEDSPLGFNIAFCENLFESSPSNGDHVHHDGHSHSHGNDDAPADGSGIVPLSNHCSVAFMGGIFIEHLSFNVNQYLEQLDDRYDSIYLSPSIVITYYRNPQSRAPPVVSLV